MSQPYRRNGTFYSRKRVPADLVCLLGKTEITESLGTSDPEEAKRRHLKFLVKLEERWEQLRSAPRAITEREAHALAQPVYDHWLEQWRDHPGFQVLWQLELYPVLWTAELEPEVEAAPGVPGLRSINNVFLKSMRLRCVESAEELLRENGLTADDYNNRWMMLKAVAAAYQRASLVLAREEHGNYSEHVGTRVEPGEPKGRRNSTSASVTFSDLLEGWWLEGRARGLKPSTYQSYRNTIATLERFLGHSHADRLTKDDIIRFKEYRLTTPSHKTGKVVSAKTIRDSDLAGLKAVFAWAVANGKLPTNPATGVALARSKAQRLRSKGFTETEAVAILKAALAHEGGAEHTCTTAAKKWVPWLAAFTGARVGELAQLRKQDIKQVKDLWIIRITPEAGTVKTNEAREVVLHSQLIALGFLGFVQQSDEGHLFIASKEDDVRGSLKGLTNRLAEFARKVVSDPGVAPNHGWRHRFTTIGLEAGVSARVLNAIQGHAPTSVSDRYGDVTHVAIANAIRALPFIDVS